jgi:vancomycin permeability regulator SanA
MFSARSMDRPHRNRGRNLLVFFLLWFLIHTVYLISDGLRSNMQHADVAVIMGSKVNEDGSLSVRLQQRLDCGASLFQAHQVQHLIVSGGLGKEGFKEGDKMREYLLQSGIPDSVILVDNQGDNTKKSVANSIVLCRKYGYDSLIVVSQYFHITRSKMLFRKMGMSNVSGAAPRYFEWRDLYAIPREVIAFYHDLF